MYEVLKSKDGKYYFILWYDKYKHRFSRTGKYNTFGDARAAAERMKQDNENDRNDRELH